MHSSGPIPCALVAHTCAQQAMVPGLQAMEPLASESSSSSGEGRYRAAHNQRHRNVGRRAHACAPCYLAIGPIFPGAQRFQLARLLNLLCAQRCVDSALLMNEPGQKNGGAMCIGTERTLFLFVSGACVPVVVPTAGPPKNGAVF